MRGIRKRHLLLASNAVGQHPAYASNSNRRSAASAASRFEITVGTQRNRFDRISKTFYGGNVGVRGKRFYTFCRIVFIHCVVSKLCNVAQK